MGRSMRLKAIINKANNQINLSIPKKKLPIGLQRKLKDRSFNLKFLDMQLEGFE